MRYHEQIEAESAIVSIDRSYILGTWCRAIKAQPISGPSATKDLCEISLKEFRGKKFARADVIVSTPLSGGPIPRDNWVMVKIIVLYKKLLFYENYHLRSSAKFR